MTYSYDPLGRLKVAFAGPEANPTWKLDWDYDRYGNRPNQNVRAGSPPGPQLTIDPNTNRITGTGYSYDANGNMTADGLNSLVHDAENRTVSINGGAGSYSYDGNGLRVKKQAGGTTTVYVFSGTKVIGEYENSAPPGSPTREYIYSGSSLLATVEGGTTKYHHPDHLSVRVNTDSGGTMIAQSGHYPFGENWYESGGTNKLKFTTYERDAESLNDYAMARSYINRFGRFVSPDPIAGSIADPQSLNRYAYVQNDPINNTDALGLRMDPTGCGALDRSCGGGGSIFSYTYMVDGVLVAFAGPIPHMLDLGVGFAACPFNTCSVTLDDGQVASYYAYADGSSGYETRDFVGYSPAHILATVQVIVYAVNAAPVDPKTNQNADENQLMARLAGAFQVPVDEIQFYRGPGGNLFALLPSGDLINLLQNREYSSLGDSSLFHGVFSVDSREYTANTMDSLHIPMLDPSLVSLIGWGAQNYLYIGDFHADLYNPRQNFFGHVCQVLKLCH